ncbi:VanW family protein [Patescibacteria group bacterium]
MKRFKKAAIQLINFIKNNRFYYFSVLILLMLTSIYHLYFGKKIIPGVHVAGVDLGGMTYSRALSTLEQVDLNTQKKIIFTLNDSVYELDAKEIYLKYSWDATVSRAFEVGRTGSFFRDTKEKIAGGFKKLYIAVFYDFEEDPLDRFLASIQGEVNNFAKDAEFVVDGDTLAIQKEVVGYKVEEENLYAAVSKALADMNFKPMEIPVGADEPEVVSSSLKPVLEEASKIVFNPLEITFEERSWALTPTQKLEFLTYEVEEKYLGFNKERFKAFLEPITDIVNTLPRGKVTSMQEHRVAGFELVSDGIDVDIDETTEYFKDAYFGLQPEAKISVNFITGPVGPGDFGIYSILGEGKSIFTGSAPGRVHNLTLAAERTSGVLVPPGSVYSMNESIGPVTGSTGYDSAWVILGDRTVLGHGGGVCQTSTTLFRAILDAGLPVVERNPHAYRVGYYELGSSVGIDASVYQPSLDLKFKNDTPNYILVQSSWDLEEQSLTFQLFGTPDGREVHISEPVIASQSPPPEPLYQDDPSLAKGIVRQIDFSAWGANVSFNRTVTKNGEVLYEDIFKTSYQPWRAIYLVGTKS